MLLIPSFDIEIVKDVTIDHVQRMTTIIKARIHLFLHMLWYAPVKFVVLLFSVLLIMQNL